MEGDVIQDVAFQGLGLRHLQGLRFPDDERGQGEDAG